MEDIRTEYVRPEGSGGHEVFVIATYCANAGANVLRGVLELSFAAGADGEDFDDWFEDLEIGLAKRFYYRNGQHATWFDKVSRRAWDAYDGGLTWREISDKGSDAPSRAMTVARAYAAIYADKSTDIEGENWYDADDAVGAAARQIAKHQPVTAEQAAFAAVTAFQELKAPLSPDAPLQAMRRATNGAEERDRRNGIVARIAEMDSEFVSDLFGAAE